MEAREDCLLAVLERHHRLSPEDCGELTTQKWHAECLFQLAERQGRAGELSAALQTCASSLYARFCSWHLLQDQVQASLDDAPVVAEARLDGFAGVTVLPDAAFQFWMIRFREQATDGRSLDESDCHGLRERGECERAVVEYVRRKLDAISHGRMPAVCGGTPGRRAMAHGQPAWKAGPLATSAEDAWVAERCR